MPDMEWKKREVRMCCIEATQVRKGKDWLRRRVKPVIEQLRFFWVAGSLDANGSAGFVRPQTDNKQKTRGTEWAPRHHLRRFCSELAPLA
jgi:hypothetical protein